jgi:hypothetical protein
MRAWHGTQLANTETLLLVGGLLYLRSRLRLDLLRRCRPASSASVPRGLGWASSRRFRWLGERGELGQRRAP